MKPWKRYGLPFMPTISDFELLRGYKFQPLKLREVSKITDKIILRMMK